MNVNGKHYYTLWFEDNKLKMINQPLLPHRFEILEYTSHKEVAAAIKTMVTRGAIAIGAAGAYGMVLACLEGTDLDEAKDTLAHTRPTAQNLFVGIKYIYDAVKDLPRGKRAAAAINAGAVYARRDVEHGERIGKHGAQLIKDGFKIETHCNAGWLAFIDWGSALSPIYAAHRQGKRVKVFVDETRPRCQGARLTAWELLQEGIDHTIIADNAGAYFMEREKIDLMITGADRIAANGDTANKIGTFEKAIACRYFGIPFYIAAPSTTFDLNCASGKDIPIEERDGEEVACMFGHTENGDFSKVRIAPKASPVSNPAFDVTPADLIAGFITEKGIIPADREHIAERCADHG